MWRLEFWQVLLVSERVELVVVSSAVAHIHSWRKVNVPWKLGHGDFHLWKVVPFILGSFKIAVMRHPILLRSPKSLHLWQLVGWLENWSNSEITSDIIEEQSQHRLVSPPMPEQESKQRKEIDCGFRRTRRAKKSRWRLRKKRSVIDLLCGGLWSVTHLIKNVHV